MAGRHDDWLKPDLKSPIALVLSGGGARGAFQVGVWKTLLRDARGLCAPPDVISGTSAGALNGALIAAGLSPDDMMEFWLEMADSPPVVANEKFFRSLSDVLAKILLREPVRGVGRRLREARILASVVKKHKWYTQSGLAALLLEFLMTARFDTLSTVLDGIRTPYLFDTSPVRDRLRRYIGADTVRTTRVRLAINTVDVRTGSVVRIVNFRPEKSPRASSKHYRYEPAISLDMLLASSAIPLLFNPVEVDSDPLWDGGLLVNSPMAPAVALGATRIVPVLATTKGSSSRHVLQTFGHAVERLVDTILENAYNIDRKLLLDRNELARKTADPDLKQVELFRAIRPQSGELFNAGSYLYFERRALLAMYEAGQHAARDWIARGPEVDRRDLDD
jgi:predicted acylesterase/phospholipase RssA